MEGFLNPQEALKQLKLKDDFVVADFGSGSGGWVMPLAKQVEGGDVYAIDILEEPLSALRAKADLEKLYNIKTIQSDVEKPTGSTLADSLCDLVLMTNLLFQVDSKEKVLAEGKRVLKEKGKILVVDWKKDAPLGPKEGRIGAEEVKKIAKGLKLKVEKQFTAGIYHYGLILVK